MEQRVAKLEVYVSRIAAVIERLEPKITEILMTGARRSDVDAFRAEARLETEKLRGEVREVSGRLASLPTTWTILGVVFSTWAIGSGIVFTIAKLAK
jgi:hypothetical protein